MFRMLESFTAAIAGSYNKDGPYSHEQSLGAIVRHGHDLEILLNAMESVFTDHRDEGLGLLKEIERDPTSDPVIVNLGLGVLYYVEAMMEFDTECIKRASQTLHGAERLAIKAKVRAEHLGFSISGFYAPGTEYALYYTEACLLQALMMMLSPSVVENTKALFKFRKAYQMLRELHERVNKAEDKAEDSKWKMSHLPQGERSRASSESTNTSTSVFGSSKLYEGKLDNEILALMTHTYKLRTARLRDGGVGSDSLAGAGIAVETLKDLSGTEINGSTIDIMSIAGENQKTIRDFINSGVDLCFGIQQVVLSLLPPTLETVLFIIGFRGARSEGLRLVWEATKYRDVHGAVALFGLLIYYEGPTPSVDSEFDVPPSKLNKQDQGTSRAQDDLGVFTLIKPTNMLEEALHEVRRRSPKSPIWLLQESRILSSKGKHQEAIDLSYSIDASKIGMPQVKTFLIFDRINNLVAVQEYEKAAEDSLSLTDVAPSNKAFFTYYAGCCYLECFRLCELDLLDRKKQDFYRKRANDLIFSSISFFPEKFGCRVFPLDRFVLRKVRKFQETQKRLGLKEPISAIAISPVHELNYLFTGFGRMTTEHTKMTYKVLTEYTNPAINAGDPNEEMIRQFLLALCFRNLGSIDTGCRILDEKLIPLVCRIHTNGKVKYIKNTADPWLYPTILYERALFCWKLKGLDGVKEAREWLYRAQNYMDDYELSSRIGLKIKVSLDKLLEVTV
ncbi:uncharacterized protein Ecym_6332 [Eremothecium cymbalariae DBVPG|uniref:Inclusion body clearance protein IML2 n=1 Tax=Eremothecium cymbalariae (strain CBS 270.75 / DBVPG 7215 / KCTC 17166 / NRRL Y-17582) TaxID=931890 RepID=G8JUC8_ERECY|nr:hypothetical protein Ecym_6332 [Eremothecium cymbalariae DBVPG\